jgi:acetyl-CoA synthetase
MQIKPYITAESYTTLYKQSLEDPDGFWREHAQILEWIKPFQTVKNTSFQKSTLSIRWFEEGTLNVCVNCVDRHLPARKDQVAFIFERNQPGQSRAITYQELYEEVCCFANVLKGLGVQKGDTVTIYMPMIPQTVYAILACARIGAIHSVVFGGFSATALAGRIEDCESKIVITADYGFRGTKRVALKEAVDKALEQSEKKTVTRVVVVKNDSEACPLQAPRDVWYHDLAQKAETTCPPEEMGAEDPLFILYTSGSTGKPKGVLHTSGGYLLYAALTHKYVFDYHEGDIFWCTADVGWITGHSYGVYGPLANGATSVLFEGIPTYPTPARFWEVVDQHKVTIFYTAPTAIRSLMGEGDSYLTTTTRKSLRILGSVGEPLNPEAWHWYHTKIGQSRCPIVDTWWQTETGGILITPLPGVSGMKPGSVAKPFFGVQPVLFDDQGQEIQGAGEGTLGLKDSWPGQMRGIYKDPKRFVETYFNSPEGVYTSGDGARRDEDGDYWITGREDDVIKVSGHRLGTAEIEAALDEHPLVSESAVVGIPHSIKGEGIVAFVILMGGKETPASLTQELLALVIQTIGALAKPEAIHVVPGLPKTRSGKIMRRILRKLATHQSDEIGDTSTLADPEIVDVIAEILKS